MTQTTIPEPLRPIVLDLAARGTSSRQIAVTLAEMHGYSTSHAAVARFVKASRPAAESPVVEPVEQPHQATAPAPLPAVAPPPVAPPPAPPAKPTTVPPIVRARRHPRSFDRVPPHLVPQLLERLRLGTVTRSDAAWWLVSRHGVQNPSLDEISRIAADYHVEIPGPLEVDDPPPLHLQRVPVPPPPAPPLPRPSPVDPRLAPSEFRPWTEADIADMGAYGSMLPPWLKVINDRTVPGLVQFQAASGYEWIVDEGSAIVRCRPMRPLNPGEMLIEPTYTRVRVERPADPSRVPTLYAIDSFDSATRETAIECFDGARQWAVQGSVASSFTSAALAEVAGA